MSAAAQELKQLLVVLNPAAGPRKRALLDLTLAYLKVRGWDVELFETAAAGDAQHHVQQYSGDASIVIAAGGDGTVNEVINGLSLRREPLILAIVPLGTTNVVAKELDLPATAEGLAQLIDKRKVKDCYWPEVNGRLFAFSLGVGFDASVVSAVNLNLKRRLGKLAYAVAAIKPLWQWRSRGYRVTIDGKERRADSLLVSNGRYYAGRYVVAAEMDVSQPSVQVLLISAAGPGALVSALLRLPLGGFESGKRVSSFSAKTLTVERRGNDEILQVDGDAAESLPLKVEAGTKPMPVICGY
ncbi:diacylglycerol kinase family lipid kinase [Aestuariirhabdus sp. Z084]|uniref:diacylglycerol/lipid kinase family protein n=1 Tax=Aestuariirhabdus haliotis TaxID=2918751 RepID=UPI00201B45FE|nr:diacylglycerol kinase family protein [Aestuariirhabdus haliotis]MCL6417190.1 diacylglycerol kinase family lipid kinase [Aestuariirhabdus haliotis]MCL6421162.1 diacylglycerol kinase family lipid kinase [Aestuariirhabdus haliotis]